MKESLFILFSIATLLGALGVIVSRNAVYAAFNLVLSFFCLAAIYVLWNNPFIAVVQILIYAGAIVVLFVFVVMLLDLREELSSYPSSWTVIIIGGLTVFAFSILLLRGLNQSAFFMPSEMANGTDMKNVAMMLFTEYLWPFEILSVFLLALIIGVVAIARERGLKQKEGA